MEVKPDQRESVLQLRKYLSRGLQISSCEEDGLPPHAATPSPVPDHGQGGGAPHLLQDPDAPEVGVAEGGSNRFKHDGLVNDGTVQVDIIRAQHALCELLVLP